MMGLIGRAKTTKTTKTKETAKIFLIPKFRCRLFRLFRPILPINPILPITLVRNPPPTFPTPFALSENFAIFVRFMCARVHHAHADS